MVIQKFSHARVYEWFVGTKVENKDMCVLCEKVRDISQIGSETREEVFPSNMKLCSSQSQQFCYVVHPVRDKRLLQWQVTHSHPGSPRA